MLLALVVAIGLVAHGVRAADSGIKMAASMAIDMPMPGKCDDCGDNQKAMAAGACSAYCGTMVALPLFGSIFDVRPAETLRHLAEPNPTGHSTRPDPYPPRPAVLS